MKIGLLKEEKKPADARVVLTPQQCKVFKTIYTDIDLVVMSSDVRCFSDELFMVFKGTLLIDFRNSSTVAVKEGELLIIPKGVEHRPHTNGEVVFNLLFEPKTTLHTGNVETELTVKKLDWI